MSAPLELWKERSKPIPKDCSCGCEGQMDRHKRCVSTTQAAIYLQVHVRTVYGKVRSGELPVRKRFGLNGTENTKPSKQAIIQIHPRDLCPLMGERYRGDDEPRLRAAK